MSAEPSKYAPDSEEAQVLATVQSLLDAIPTRSLSACLVHTVPAGGAQTLHSGTFETQTIEALCAGLATISPGSHLTERFVDPDVRIDESGRLAVVWSRSEISLDGTVVIKGTNVLSLHKLQGSWMISSISDASMLVEVMGQEASGLH